MKVYFLNLLVTSNGFRTLHKGGQGVRHRHRQDLRRHGESSCQRRANPKGTKEDAQGNEIRIMFI